jgi:hypothetical protein
MVLSFQESRVPQKVVGEKHFRLDAVKNGVVVVWAGKRVDCRAERARQVAGLARRELVRSREMNCPETHNIQQNGGRRLATAPYGCFPEIMDV